MQEVRKVNWFILATVLFVLAMSVPMSFVKNVTVNVFLAAFVYLLPLLIYYLIWGRKENCIMIGKVKVGVVLKCVLLYVCILPIMTLLNAISMLYSSNEAVDMLTSMTGNSTPFAVTLFVTAIVPPICEELTYRGVIYGTYRKVNPLGAIVMTGVVFGLMHGNLNQFTYAAALGMFFCLVVEATDSVVTTMIIHALVNGFSVCLYYLLDYMAQWVGRIYEEALEAGDTMTIGLLNGMWGDPNELNSVGDLMAASETMTSGQHLAQIVSCILPAVIGGLLAFLLYRNIARSCGRWERIVSIFSRKNRELVPEYHTLWTAGLVIACAALVVEMVAYMFMDKLILLLS